MQDLKKDMRNALPAVRVVSQPTQYYAELKATQCSDHPFLRRTLNISELFSQWKDSGNISSAIKCKQCGTIRCAGCCTVHKAPSQKRITMGKVTVDYCCSKGQLFVIWILLCGLDDIITNRKLGASSNTSANPFGRNLMDDPKAYWLRLMGSTDQNKGTGYGGGSARMDTLIASSALTNTPEDQKDAIIGDILAVMTQMLTGTDAPTSEHLFFFIEGSTILDKVAELLRNDSIKNVTKRHALYKRVLNFVEVLAKNPRFSKAVSAARMAKDADATLLSICQGTRNFKQGQSNKELSFLLQGLSKQAQFIVNAARVASREYADQEGQMQLALCKQIIALSRTLSPGSQAKGTQNTARLCLKQYHQEHACEAVSDQVMQRNYSFTREAMMVASYGSPHGRMKKLVEQVANMQTSLPEGIFVRYGSSRPDMLKALITGPKGTPYENGLFEFDILCPREYPQVSPLVVLKTTGGGRVSFNPNLYADGKVCLSILGTFPGQKWMPNQSTLLQVLVSIQSMILCDNPFFNEPGTERVQGHPMGQTASAKRNAVYQASTMRHAITEWMQKCEQSMWRDVIKLHFVENAATILGTAERWSVQAYKLAMPSGWATDMPGVAGLMPHEHQNPYTAAHVPQLKQELALTISRFLQKYGRR